MRPRPRLDRHGNQDQLQLDLDLPGKPCSAGEPAPLGSPPAAQRSVRRPAVPPVGRPSGPAAAALPTGVADQRSPTGGTARPAPLETHARKASARLPALPRPSGKRPDRSPPRSNARTVEAVLLTVEQAADALGLGRTNLYKLLENGTLRSVKIGRARRIPIDAIHEFVHQAGNTQPPQQ